MLEAFDKTTSTSTLYVDPSFLTIIQHGSTRKDEKTREYRQLEVIYRIKRVNRSNMI